jgi:hypothetical protein
MNILSLICFVWNRHLIASQASPLIWYCSETSILTKQINDSIYLRNKSWKPECVGSFNMDWRILVFYPEPEARDKIYWWYNPIRTCAGECDWLFHWQHKLCATFSTNVNIKYCLPIKIYYRICTLRHIRIEINHGSQNMFSVLTWVGGY